MEIICDFDTVAKLGDNISNIGIEADKKTSTLKGNVESDFSTWSGQASASFDETVAIKMAEVDGVNESAKYAGAYITYCSTSIEDLDNQLAKAKV